MMMGKWRMGTGLEQRQSQVMILHIDSLGLWLLFYQPETMINFRCFFNGALFWGGD